VAPFSPTVAGWELALRLRRRREELGVEVRTITQELGFTRNYWSAVENERKILSEESLTKVVALFEFDKDERDELLDLRAAARQRGWWSQYSALFDSDVQRFFGLEAGAESVQIWESLMIPGILQTADYIAAIMRTSVTIRPVEVEQRVAARLKRQERLTGDAPLRLRAMLSEAVLRQEIGGPEVLRAQLEHVCELAESYQDTIEVRVIPFTATECGLFGAATVNLIDFESARLPTVFWQETVTSWAVVDDPHQVRNLGTTYGDALKHALNTEDSLNMIRARVRELA
jgi:transcriptional regulator with XRE-family HTH domain